MPDGMRVKGMMLRMRQWVNVPEGASMSSTIMAREVEFKPWISIWGDKFLPSQVLSTGTWLNPRSTSKFFMLSTSPSHINTEKIAATRLNKTMDFAKAVTSYAFLSASSY
jgi:hypothetical protein